VRKKRTRPSASLRLCWLVRLRRIRARRPAHPRPSPIPDGSTTARRSALLIQGTDRVLAPSVPPKPRPRLGRRRAVVRRIRPAVVGSLAVLSGKAMGRGSRDRPRVPRRRSRAAPPRAELVIRRRGRTSADGLAGSAAATANRLPKNVERPWALDLAGGRVSDRSGWRRSRELPAAHGPAYLMPRVKQNTRGRTGRPSAPASGRRRGWIFDCLPPPPGMFRGSSAGPVRARSARGEPAVVVGEDVTPLRGGAPPAHDDLGRAAATSGSCCWDPSRMTKETPRPDGAPSGPGPGGPAAVPRKA